MLFSPIRHEKDKPKPLPPAPIPPATIAANATVVVFPFQTDPRVSHT